METSVDFFNNFFIPLVKGTSVHLSSPIGQREFVLGVLFLFP